MPEIVSVGCYTTTSIINVGANSVCCGNERKKNMCSLSSCIVVCNIPYIKVGFNLLNVLVVLTAHLVSFCISPLLNTFISLDMHFRLPFVTTSTIALTASTGLAFTPPNFQPSSATNLTVVFGSLPAAVNGVYLVRNSV